MTIPSVMQGLIETEDGKVFELDSPKGAAWLESIGSFRYEPTGDGKAYTVRKEGKSGEYWYGCRKVAGKVRKKYIGKSSEVSIARLEEIAEALEVPTEPRVKQVAEVAERVAEVLQVVEVAEGVAQDRLTALEVQVAELLKAVKGLQEALPGKSESGDSLKLPKIDNEVVEQLQNELGNLKAENEKLQADYAALLKSSTDVTNKLREEVREVRSQLATERADREEVEIRLADLKQNSAAASELPDAGEILNRLKAKREEEEEGKSQPKRKKSLPPLPTLTTIEAILEMIEE